MRCVNGKGVGGSVSAKRAVRRRRENPGRLIGTRFRREARWRARARGARGMDRREPSRHVRTTKRSASVFPSPLAFGGAPQQHHDPRSRVTPRSSDDSAGVRTPRRIARRERDPRATVPSRARSANDAGRDVRSCVPARRAFACDSAPRGGPLRVHAGRADSSRVWVGRRRSADSTSGGAFSRAARKTQDLTVRESRSFAAYNTPRRGSRLA